MQHTIFAISYHLKMDKKLYTSLKQGLEEAIAISRGELAAGRIWVIQAPDKNTSIQRAPVDSCEPAQGTDGTHS